MDIIPFDDRDGVIWYNGDFTAWRDAKVHILNHGLHYASSIFEGERIYNGKIFKSKQHSERLFNSAKIMGFTIDYEIDKLEDVKKELVKRQNITNGYMRVFAFRGSEKMAISAQNNKIHLAASCWSWPPYYSDEARKKGISLKTAKYRRPDPRTAPVQAKAAGLYMTGTISKHEAESEGYNDALMLDYKGYLAEATGANLFLLINDQLHTPIPESFLNGITRQTIIEIAKENNIKVIERDIEYEELSNAKDAFLTGTAAEITRISMIDKKYFYPQPSQITETLITKYHQLVRS